MLLGGIKFNDDELAPKQESTKFSAYYDKFKEIFEYNCVLLEKYIKVYE